MSDDKESTVVMYGEDEWAFFHAFLWLAVDDECTLGTLPGYYPTFIAHIS